MFCQMKFKISWISQIFVQIDEKPNFVSDTLNQRLLARFQKSAKNGWRQKIHDNYMLSKNMWIPKFPIGMNEENRTIKLSQRNIIKRLLLKLNMADNREKQTQIEANLIIKMGDRILLIRVISRAMWMAQCDDLSRYLLRSIILSRSSHSR